MATTKRMQNRCKKCGYTWYPRGKNLSLKCPSCGSNEVGFAGGGIFLFALIIVGLYVFGGDKHPQPSAVNEASAPSMSANSGVVTGTEPALPIADAAEPSAVAEAVTATLPQASASVESESTSNLVDASVGKEDLPPCKEEPSGTKNAIYQLDNESTKKAKCQTGGAVRNDLF